MRARAIVSIALLILAAQISLAGDLKALAATAISSNSDEAKSAITQLREAGPTGLAAMLDVHRQAIEQHRAAGTFASLCTPEWKRLAEAIDTVAAQRDAWASGLYWYTDLDEAMRVAQEQNKPILSLRLLGNLNEEYSCANSRFFRTALYANKEISSYLSQNFVLHWKSVRPVPKITIDFGDGRKIERTITGNSIHYVLLPNGQILDAIPGLYGPTRFLSIIQTDVHLATQLASATDSQSKAAQLAAFHINGSRALQLAYASDLAKVKGTPTFAPAAKNGPAPSAKKAAPIAVSKAAGEVPVLNQIMPGDNVAVEDATWKAIAALHADDAKLDRGSVTLVASKQDPAAAMRRATSKRFVEDPMLKVVANFERSIAEDTVRNEYLMHRQIHDWLAQSPAIPLNQFNEIVYAQLFLTPSSDPWLGLAPADTYTALPSEGLVVTKK